jgi:hypothetical protein
MRWFFKNKSPGNGNVMIDILEPAEFDSYNEEAKKIM